MHRLHICHLCIFPCSLTWNCCIKSWHVDEEQKLYSWLFVHLIAKLQRWMHSFSTHSYISSLRIIIIVALIWAQNFRLFHYYFEQSSFFRVLFSLIIDKPSMTHCNFMTSFKIKSKLSSKPNVKWKYSQSDDFIRAIEKAGGAGWSSIPKSNEIFWPFWQVSWCGHGNLFSFAVILRESYAIIYRKQ